MIAVPPTPGQIGRVSFDLNRAGLHRLLETTTGPVGQAMHRIGVRVQNQAKVNCPLDTGKLRSSIAVIQTDGMDVRVEAATGYAIYVHDGTSRMPARPFLADALREVMGGLK